MSDPTLPAADDAPTGDGASTGDAPVVDPSAGNGTGRQPVAGNPAAPVKATDDPVRTTPASSRPIILWLLVGGLLILVTGLMALMRQQDNAWQRDVTVSTHTPGLIYNGNLPDEVTPPSGGPHHSMTLNCGVYSAPVPTTLAVSTLEHGVVWITYRADRLDAAEIEQLHNIHLRYRRTIISPYPSQRAPVSVTAWNHQLLLPNVDDRRLERFLRDYTDRLDAPKPGRPCNDGMTHMDLNQTDPLSTGGDDDRQTSSGQAGGETTGTVTGPPTEESVKALIGLGEVDAETIAERNGWAWRVVERDGVSFPGTADWRDDRVNVTVEGGQITAVSIG